MRKYQTLIIILCFYLVKNDARAQGTLPIYSDYLTDNIFLVHPSAAGMSNGAPLRLTHRQQWSDNSEAPSLQTISFHNRFGEKMALGAIIFNDKNGFHSQIGIQGTYAYHLNFGRDEALNQLSFALSASFVQNSVDQRSFSIPDPVISQIVESDSYFNADFSAAYFNLDGYAYLTVKNLLLNSRTGINENYQSVNLRRYLLNIGYFFGWGRRMQIEPSMMFQLVERTNEVTLDINTKIYRLIGTDKRLWVALSYRRSIESNEIQALSQITPIVGIEFKRYIASYTYTHQLGEITFQNGGFHQFTLGINLFEKRPKDRGYIQEYNPFLFKSKN